MSDEAAALYVFGSPEHQAVLSDRILGCIAGLDIPADELTRQVFLRWSRSAHGTTRGVSARGLCALGGWTMTRDTALRSGGRLPVSPIPAGHFVHGVSTLIGKDGQTKNQWIKTAKASESRAEILERLLADLPSKVPVLDEIPAPTRPATDELLTVYPMGDPHIGMLSWAPETGDNFNLAIATSITRAAIDELVQHEPRSSEALIVNLGDFFHSDNAQNRTARSGNALDVDGRFPKVLRVGIELMIYAIAAALRAHARVKVVCLPGNHDDHTSLMLQIALDLHFASNPRVTIETSPAARVYHRFGANLLGMTHGHTRAARKSQDLESCMANERPRDWGETRHRWFLTGHLHHKVQEETRGMVREVFRTLAARDAWHAAEGYIGAQRDMCRVSLHREWGEIGRTVVGADYLGARMRAGAQLADEIEDENEAA